MQRNRSVLFAVVASLALGAVAAGYLIAQFTAVGYRPIASPATPESTAMPAMPMSPATSSSASPGFSSASLAQFIARKAGTRLAGAAPQTVPVSQVAAASDSVPAGASIDRGANTIAFTGSTVSFTVVAIAPDAPDMTFRIAGLNNPAIVVPDAAKVTVRFINNDTDEAHGWLVRAAQSEFTFGQPSTPAIAGASAAVVGDPVSAGDGAETITFAAGLAGRYDYICPMPGHAQMGMHGTFTVR